MRRIGQLLFVALATTYLCLSTQTQVFGEVSPCPPADSTILCAEWDEPQGVQGLTRTVLTITKNGKALPAVTLPATAAAGGGHVSSSVATDACVRDEYAASAMAEYLIDGVTVQSVGSESVPATITKDRSSQQGCSGSTAVNSAPTTDIRAGSFSPRWRGGLSTNERPRR